MAPDVSGARVVAALRYRIASSASTGGGPLSFAVISLPYFLLVKPASTGSVTPVT
jgi:hypothetical protein